MTLRSLYTVRFIYPDGWSVELTGPGGTEEQHYYLAEGRCEGTIAGTFRASNHPRRRSKTEMRQPVSRNVSDLLAKYK